MKKFILPIILLLIVLVFFHSKADAQASPNCHEAFDKELYKCLVESTACINSCADKASSVMSLSVDGGKVNIECQRNTCDSAKESCDNKVKANFRACQDAKNSPKNSAKEVGLGFDKEEFSSEIETNVVNEWIKNNFGELDMKKIEAGTQLDRQPIIIKEEQAVVVEAPGQDQFYLGMSYTNGLVKIPDSQEFTDFQDIWHIPTGSTVKATDQPIRINIGTKKVLVIAPGSEAVLTSDRQIDILKGTIEVQKEGIFSRDSKQETGARTEFIDLFVIGTHYWVTHDPSKQTLIGVYDGEVEVKTKDGQTIKIKPDGNKPGVVVVSQKLSLVKLAVIGMVLAAIIGGVVRLIKKKNKVLYSKKR